MRKKATVGQVGLPGGMPPVIIGRLFCPPDLPVGDFLLNVRQNGQSWVATNLGQFIPDVALTVQVQQSATYPEESGGFGSYVVCLVEPYHKAVIAAGVLTANDQLPLTAQKDLLSMSVGTPDMGASLFLRDGNGTLAADGQLSLQAKNADSTGVLSVLADGLAVTADSCTLSASDRVTIDVRSSRNASGQSSTVTVKAGEGIEINDNYGNRILIDEGGVTIESSKVQIGGSTGNPAVTGNELRQVLGDILTQLQLLTVTCGPPGSASTVPVNAAAFQVAQQNLDRLLSRKVFIS